MDQGCHEEDSRNDDFGARGHATGGKLVDLFLAVLALSMFWNVLVRGLRGRR